MMIPSWEFDRVGATYDSVYGRIKCLIEEEEMNKFNAEVESAKHYLETNTEW